MLFVYCSAFIEKMRSSHKTGSTAGPGTLLSAPTGAVAFSCRHCMNAPREKSSPLKCGEGKGKQRHRMVSWLYRLYCSTMGNSILKSLSPFSHQRLKHYFTPSVMKMNRIGCFLHILLAGTHMKWFYITNCRINKNFVYSTSKSSSIKWEQISAVSYQNVCWAWYFSHDYPDSSQMSLYYFLYPFTKDFCGDMQTLWLAKTSSSFSLEFLLHGQNTQ